jgi:hypothetical protein
MMRISFRRSNSIISPCYEEPEFYDVESFEELSQAFKIRKQNIYASVPLGPG